MVLCSRRLPRQHNLVYYNWLWRSQRITLYVKANLLEDSRLHNRFSNVFYRNYLGFLYLLRLLLITYLFA